ncbi:hypothetical protein, partial [Thiolapillus sp.]|uniref:hypothetical protein n=1 Tax=Thiolapillus sp. TaxID=2017437 RepID=UPI003AF6AC06
MSPTTPRGARELTGTMSRASNANENLAQCGDNAGQNNKPDKHSASDATLSNKSDNECLPSVPNDQHDILISENMASNVKSLSFLHWNVNGLLSKIQDSDFMSYLCTFDFVCIVETFVEEIQSNVFVGYNVFCKPAVKFTRQGRCSGGVICLVKNVFAPYVRKLDIDCGNFILLIIDKSVFGLQKDVLYVCAYVPPEGSPYYNYFDVENGIGLLEDCLSECMINLNDIFVILSGDLNSRTSNISKHVTTDTVFDSPCKSSPINADRCSEDGVLNNYGKSLLDLCTALNLCILNGMCPGDYSGRYTYISDTGSSVNDYFLLSNDLFVAVYDSCKLVISERIESDHMPVELYFRLLKEKDLNADEGDEKAFIDKFVWNPSNAQAFKDSFDSDEARTKLEYAINMINVDINKALRVFDEFIKEMAKCMKKRVFSNKHRKSREWFDFECNVNRRNVRKQLRKYRHTLKADDRNAFCIARREYKNLLKRKKKQYNDSLLNMLLISVKSQRDFWDAVHKVSFKRKFVTNNIAVDDWFEHFRTLLEKDVNTDDTPVSTNVDDDDNPILNRPISDAEVLLAIRKIKPRKAAGPDGIIGEIIKHAGGRVTDFFVKFFNTLFD